MRDDSLTFGDVFEFGNGQFVFLASTLDNLYVARVLSAEDSKKLNNFCSSKISKNFPRTDTILFCYVILTTEEVKDRAAQYGMPELENHLSAFHKLPITLKKSDLKNLKDGILNTRATPIGLKEIIKDIDLVS
jgi:hypothetical protein